MLIDNCPIKLLSESLYPATDGTDAETHSQTLVELGESCGRG